MAKHAGQDGSQIDHVYDLLLAAPFGLHDLAKPAGALPDDAPLALAEWYVLIGGASLFHEAIVFAPPNEVHLLQDPARWWCGSVDGDDLAVTPQGRVLCWDSSVDDWLPVGSRLDRWLWGMLDGQALLYDAEGEFADDVFDEDGELSDATTLAQLRGLVRRDGAAVASRWRLGAAFVAAGDILRGREQLERCVELDEDFYWAWLELARISENLAEFANAYEEALTAAHAAQKCGAPSAGYLWSHAARLALRSNANSARDAAAAQVQRLAPQLRTEQLAGIRECMANRDWKSAGGLMDLLRAVWPRDLEVMDMARQLAAAPRQEPEVDADEGLDTDDADASEHTNDIGPTDSGSQPRPE